MENINEPEQKTEKRSYCILCHKRTTLHGWLDTQKCRDCVTKTTKQRAVEITYDPALIFKLSQKAKLEKMWAEKTGLLYYNAKTGRKYP